MASLHLHDMPLSALYRLLEPVIAPASSPNATFTNWGQTFTCTPLAVFEPETEYQCELILELARREGKVVRAAGVGHSPSDLACTREYMLRTEKLNKVLEVNVEKRYVIAQCGITLQSLHEELGCHGLAMINVGSISDQTLAGIVTTATHGSGIKYGVMSTHVMAMTLLMADGTRVSCSRQEHSDLFLASLCGIGSTGLILSIKYEVEPAFRLKETQETLDFDYGMKNLDVLVSAAEYVRFWWFPVTATLRASFCDRTQEPKNPAQSWLWHSFMGYHVIQFLMFIGRYFLALNPYIMRFAAWLIRDKSVSVDDSHRILNVDCRYPQHTTEWAVPYSRARVCLHELRAWFEEEHADPDGLRPHFPVEIRFSEADDIWLSPSSGERTCWIGIVQYKPYGFNVPYRKLFGKFESIVSRHGGRPHWAKAHHLRPKALRKLYPRFDDFVRVLKESDPRGMFRNEYVNRHIFGHRGYNVDERTFRASRNTSS